MATSMHEPDWDQMSELQDRRVGARPVRREVIHVEPRFDGILGHSAALTAVLTQLELVAPTDATVLLQGETGTGKEPLARALHHRSPRRPHPFVPVNCAALPPDLLESELFGHEKGAFTGALTQRLGRFELANRGTLFLDEIGDLPLELQPKLLRVLQDHAFERLGSSRTLRTNARVVAATHRDLLAMVQQHTFRADLYYRLNIFPLTVPPQVLNALNQGTWENVRTAFEDARDDAAVRGVILTGAGDKAFIAGADISELTQVTAVEAEKSRRDGQDVVVLIRRSDSARRCSHA
jgi:transcriptional regulator with GAF, ATPase, and Fis domain